LPKQESFLNFIFGTTNKELHNVHSFFVWSVITAHQCL